jgi:hypothetical protein
MSADDLFRPTLTADHDTAGIHEPWNPWHLVMITFFFGFVAGAVLIALNAGRLSLNRWVKPVLAAGVVFLIANALVIAWIARGGPPATDGVSTPSNSELVIAGIEVDSIQPTEPPTELNTPDSLGVQDRAGLTERSRTERRFLRLGRRAVGVLFAVLLVIPQLPRYRLAEIHDLPKGKLLIPALIVIVVTLVVEFLVIGAAAALVWPQAT